MCLTQAEQHMNKLGSAFAPYIQMWGDKAVEIMGQLLQEWQSGEANFELRSKEGVRRVIRVLLLDVFYHDVKTDQLYYLKEDKQVVQATGKVIRRDKDCSVSEKLLTGERTESEGIPRALWEELGVSGPVYQERTQELREARDSRSYPLLKTLSRNIRYRVLLSRAQ